MAIQNDPTTNDLDFREFTILAVDDTPNNLELISEYLDQLGFDVMLATSGQACLDRVAYRLPDLILLDVQMPEMDGFETCQRLKDNPASRGIPVIFLTATADMADKVRGFAAGAVDYVTKPIQFVELLARIQAHLRIKLLNNKLLQADKSAGLGRLVVGIAHELNTPLGTCLTSVSYLQQKLTNLSSRFDQGHLSQGDFRYFLAETSEITELTLANLRRAIRLIGNFKQLSSTQFSAEQRVFDLGEYLEQILQALIAAPRSQGIRFDLQLSPGILIKSHPDLWPQIIEHLVENAWIHGFGHQTEGLIQVCLERRGNQAMLLFSDDGSGIPEADQVKIFEPFFTTMRHQGHIGLGLHMVWNLINDLLKGSISCTSKLGSGTSFIITVPLEPAL